MRNLLVFALSLVAVGASAACSSSDPPPNTSGSTGGGGAGGGGAGGGGGEGGMGGGGGGSGGSGGGVSCVPGATIPCYGGPPGTEGMGPCQPGIATCNADGASYGSCVGQMLPSVELCMTATDEDCTGSPTPCAEPWSARFGGAKDDATMSVAFDSSGNLAAVGWFTEGFDLGGGPLQSFGDMDMWVAKFDSAGKLAWGKSFGDTKGDVASDVAADRSSGAIAFAASFQGTIDFGGGPLTAGALDVAVVKLDSSGNHVFSKQFGGAAAMDVARSIAIDAGGNIAVVGDAPGSEPIDFGGGPIGPGNFFVVKMDSTGKHVFSARYALGEASAVALDASGNIIIGGRASLSIDFGCGPVKNSSGQLVVAKLSPSGDCIWSNGYPANSLGAPLLSSVAAGPAGEVFFTGGFYSGSIDFGGGPMTTASNSDGDAFLVKLDAAGKLVWDKHFGDLAAATGYQTGYSVAARPDGGVVVTGILSGTTDFGAAQLTGLGDAFLAGYASDGAPLFAYRYGDPLPNAQVSFAVADNGAGLVALGGYFEGSIDFGPGPLISSGALDAFIAQITP